MITEQQLQNALNKALKKQKEELLDAFSKELKGVKDDLKTLTDKVDEIQKTADDALAKAKQNEADIKTFKAALSTSAETIKALENKLEDNVNRQCRKTLIIKGIKEKPNETWDTTEQLVARKISEASNGDTSQDSALRMIERAHRSRPNKFKKGCRDIYAALYDWKDAEYVLKSFTAKNISDKSFKVFCEQKYGPLTTARRNQALIARKALKASGEIISGYVAYPAKLMVKYPGQKKDDKFSVHEDFSNIDISQEKVSVNDAEV